MAKSISPVSSASSHDLGNRNNIAATLDQIIDKFIQGKVDNSLPAIVISFDDVANIVKVQPLIKILKTDGTLVSRGTLNIPVFNFGTGKMSLRFKLSEGDLGWIQANDRDISLFLQSLSEEAPNTLRQHDFSDAIFYPDAMKGMSFTANAIMSNEAGTIKTEWFDDKIVHTAPTVETSDNLKVGTDGEIVAKFGCNGKSPQAAASVGAPATDTASAIILVNNIRVALVNNGIVTT